MSRDKGNSEWPDADARGCYHYRLTRFDAAGDTTLILAVSFFAKGDSDARVKQLALNEIWQEGSYHYVSSLFGMELIERTVKGEHPWD